MSNPTLRTLFAAALLLSLSAAQTPAATDESDAFPIRLIRPSHKGDHRNFELVFAEVQTYRTEWEGSEPKTSDIVLGARLVGGYEAVEVDPDGYELEDRFTVRKFTRIADDGTETEVLPPGSEIVARVGSGEKGETKLKVNGAESDGEVLKVLRKLIVMSRPEDNRQLRQMLEGTEPNKLRKVGESWPIDAEVGAKLFHRRFLGSGNSRDLAGDVKLVGIETTNGQRCLHLQANVRASKLATPTSTPATQPLNFKPGHSETLYEVLLPLADGRPAQSSSYSVTFGMTYDTERDGRKATGEVSTRREIRSRLLPDDPKPVDSKKE